MKRIDRIHIAITLTLLLTAIFTALPVKRVLAQSPQTTAANLYLPLVTNGRTNAGGDTPTPTPTTAPPPRVPLAMFLDPTWKTSNATVMVDGAGGEHVAFYYYEPAIEQRPDHAVYAYCPQQCDKGANWQAVPFAQGKEVSEVQLQLTRSGKPRLLIRTNSVSLPNGFDFYYAACDDGCTVATRWATTLVRSNAGTATTEFKDDDLPQRTFALDPAGRPRFLYNDGRNSNLGTFYVYCDSQCDQQSSWQQVRVNQVVQAPQYRDDNFYYPTLTFTTDGRPRIVTADFFPLDDGDSVLAYIECNAACDQSESWQAVELLVRGAGAEPSADLALDANGRPRIAFYQEGLGEGQGNKLYYLWCDDACLDAANWQSRDLGLSTMDGQEPDLALDNAGRPRIAYAHYEQGGVGLLWCNVACETTNAQWQHKVLEDRTQLYQAWPVAYPPHCDGGIWDGHTPKLVLTGNGDPQVAFDGTYHARCFYDDNPTDNQPPTLDFHLIVRAARLISIANPFNVIDEPGTPTPTATPTTTRTPTATPTATVPVTPTPPPATIQKSLALFVDPAWQTSNASVAVDNHGGKHRAYYYDAAAKGGPTYAVYEQCTSGCEHAHNWHGMTFAEDVNEVQLELDAAGNPHLLIRTGAPNTDQYSYAYAVCTGDCTQESSWAMLEVGYAIGGAAYEAHDAEQPQRSFALDPNGHPRFVYLDHDLSTTPLHAGIFYVWCDTNCGSDLSQWQEVLITDIEQWNGQIDKQEQAYYLALAFTPQGQPRLVTAEYYPYLDTTDTVWRLGYFACDEMCELGYLWNAVALYERGTGPLPSADLALDGNGHPHVAFYQQETAGVLPDGGNLAIPPRLLYLTCAAANCMTPSNWNGTEIGLGSNQGGAPDLALDAQGRPRIAYTLGAPGGLGYSWCDSNCITGAPAAWRHGVVESPAELQAALPQSHPTTCDRGGWTGLTPVLTLPATGNPHIAYDATYVAHCLRDADPNDGTPATWHDDVLRRAARIVSFTQP